MDLCVDKLPKRGTGLKKKTWNNNDLTLTPPELHAAKAVMCTMWYPRIGFMEKSFPAIADHPSSRVNLRKRIRRPRRQREWQKSNSFFFYKENNNFARASRPFIYFFAITAWIRRKYAPWKKRHPHTQARLKQSISLYRQSSEILDNNSNDFLSQMLPITKNAVST